MKSIYSLLLLLLSGLFFQCQNSENGTTQVADPVIKEERTLFPETKDSLKLYLRKKPQAFTVKVDKDTQIITQSGLKVDLPKGAFVDENNQPVFNVTLEIVEAFTVNDFIKNNLVTVSGDEILESGGMFYINAQSEGKPLKIKEDNALIVQVPAAQTIGNMQVFYGNYDEQGMLNWTPVGKSTGVIDNSMIALPRTIVNLSEISSESRFSEKLFIKREVEALDKAEYEDTYIMTNEFKQRLELYLYGAIYDPDTTALHKLLTIYTSNVDKNLSEADKLAIDFLTPRSKILFSSLRDTMIADSLAVKKDTSDFSLTSKSIVSAAVYYFGKWCWDIARKFPEANCTKPINFKKLNIDSATTKADLVAKGYSSEEASKLLFWFRQRNQQVSSLNAQEEQEKTINYTMSVKKFGWVNIDRFLNDSSCKESNFTVRLKTKDSLNTQKMFLIFPLRKICISNTYFENGQFSFTKKGTLYRKLPIGEEVYIVAVGTKGKENFYGMKKIKVPATGVIELEVSPASMKEIKSKIEKIN